MAKSKSYGGLIALLVIVGAGAAGTWYYFNNRADKQPEFVTVKVGKGDIVQSVTATGDLQPVTIVDIGAQVSGQIKEVLVDFNSKVKAGDVLARIDPATPQQKLNQAKADLESTKAQNKLSRINAERQREMFAKNLASQSELDNAEANLAQSDATLLTRTAAMENAKLDLDRCVITAPIDGMVLDRKTDVGRTVNSSMNAPTLFTLVADLTKMQINAAVAEADIGLIAEGQEVKFTVDAFPNRTFTGAVRQVRNAASANQSVVSYASIIDVSNDELKLKPGMTANVSIIVAQKLGVLRVANQALRLRVPQEMLAAKAPAAATGEKAAGKDAAPGTMSDEERMTAMRDIRTEVGYQRGTPATPEMIEKAKKLAKDKGLDPDILAATMSGGARGGKGGPGGGGRGGRGGGGGGGFGGGGGGAGDRGFNNTVFSRPVYKFADPTAKVKKLEAVTARLGISDGINTEVLDGLAEGDTLVTAIIMPGAAPILQAPGGGANSNPFQQGGRGGGMGGMGGGGMGGGGGGGRGR
jgi:HlyD family secretion protein